MESRNQRDSRLIKKIIIRTGIVIICLCVLVAVLYLMLAIIKRDLTPTYVYDDTIRFSDVDYDIDIFQDPVYATKNLNITFIEYGDSTPISDNYEEGSWHGIASAVAYRSKGSEAEFFREYFIKVISGDYKNYPKMFSDNFFKYYSLPEKFTMQKVYGIEVEVFNRTQEESGVIVSNYIVRYKIMNNNGSFRGDVPSDTVKPLYFKLVNNNGVVKIDSIIFPEEKKN